jgi:hypothetical protein
MLWDFLIFIKTTTVEYILTNYIEKESKKVFGLKPIAKHAPILPKIEPKLDVVLDDDWLVFGDNGEDELVSIHGESN